VVHKNYLLDENKKEIELEHFQTLTKVKTGIEVPWMNINKKINLVKIYMKI
jgi:hypothetical protein